MLGRGFDFATFHVPVRFAFLQSFLLLVWQNQKVAHDDFSLKSETGFCNEHVVDKRVPATVHVYIT